jgi:hypothetical protein
MDANLVSQKESWRREVILCKVQSLAIKLSGEENLRKIFISNGLNYLQILGVENKYKKGGGGYPQWAQRQGVRVRKAPLP